MYNESEETIRTTPTQSEKRSSQDEICDMYFYFRHCPKFISNLDAFVILIKSTVGTGLFAMPYAFSRVGLIFGIVLLIVIGISITKCLQLFLRVHDVTCTRLGKSTAMYDEIVESTLKNMNRRIPKIIIELATYFTNALLLFYYIGVSSVCVDFIGDVIREILTFKESDNPTRYTSLFIPFFMMLNLSKYMHDMTLKSMAGNILILNIIITGFAYAFQSDTSDTWTVLSNEYLMYPRFIGIIFYSLSSPGLVLAIRQSTDNPVNDSKFNKVLNRAMIFIIVLHLFVGIVGYVKLGSNVSENFIRDIPNDGYILLALIIQALAIYLTYGLQCYVPIAILLKQYAMPAIEYRTCKGTLYLWELIVRFAVTLVSCVPSVIIPKLRLRVAFLGLSCNVILTLLLPLTLHILLTEEPHETARCNRKVVTGIVCIIFVSILVLCCFFTDLILIFKRY